MKTALRNIGNSKGMVFPAQLLNEMNAVVGDEFDVTIQDGRYVVTPLSFKPKYKLSDLLAKCDESAPIPDEMIEWDNIQPVGNEI